MGHAAVAAAADLACEGFEQADPEGVDVDRLIVQLAL